MSNIPCTWYDECHRLGSFICEVCHRLFCQPHTISIIPNRQEHGKEHRFCLECAMKSEDPFLLPAKTRIREIREYVKWPRSLKVILMEERVHVTDTAMEELVSCIHCTCYDECARMGPFTCEMCRQPFCQLHTILVKKWRQQEKYRFCFACAIAFFHQQDKEYPSPWSFEESPESHRAKTMRRIIHWFSLKNFARLSYDLGEISCKPKGDTEIS